MILSQKRYLTGPRITEADVRLFPTLVRFDWVYHGHFKVPVENIFILFLEDQVFLFA